jgi:hypothetical protein
VGEQSVFRSDLYRGTAAFYDRHPFLSRTALGNHADAFEVDLRIWLLEVNPRGLFEEEIDFAYGPLARP